MLNSFFELLQNPDILKIVVMAVVVGLLVSLCAALLGVSLVLKRCSMIGDGLSHVGYGALAIATALKLSGDYTLEISIPLVIAAAFLLLRISNKSGINRDAAIAMVSTGAMAIGTIIFNVSGGTAGDACNSLFGSASLITITLKDMVLSIVLSLIVITAFILLYNKIFAVTFDENFAKATGIRADSYNMLLALLTAVTIVLGMQLMGAVLISGLIIFPALSAMRICKTFRGVQIAAAVISVICFLVGFLAACIFNLQTGPAVIVVNLIAFFLLSAAARLNAKKGAL